jgi:hypothetical protein
MANNAVPTFVHFASIEQLRHMLKYLPGIFADGTVPDRLMFRGTVKLHGTHADLVKMYGNTTAEDYIVQSRNRILTPESDNVGCARFFRDRDPAVEALFALVEAALAAQGRPPPSSDVVIAGEFCGGSIQPIVALCKLPKMFVVFAVRVDGAWVDMGADGFADVRLERHGIYNVMQFRTFSVVLETDNPDPARADMDRLTAEVDRECPVALEIGSVLVRDGRLTVKGGLTVEEALRGPGEGIVWTCPDHPNENRLWFKTKGDAHHTVPEKMTRNQKTSGVTLTAARANGVADLLERCLHDGRMRQGLEHLFETGRPVALGPSLQAFAMWVTDDLLKEEADAIEDSELHPEAVRAAGKGKAIAWFKAHVTASS